MAALATALAATGCASTSPQPAFRQTAQLVEARTGLRIAWNQGGAADAEISRRVRALLGPPLTVDAAVQVALLNNHGLKATYEDLSVAQADLVQAGLLQNPVFGGALAFPVAGSAEVGGSFGVTEDFLGIFTLALRKRVAQAQLSATVLRVGEAVVQLAFDVERAFFELVVAKQVGALQRAILSAEEAASEVARGQYEAGTLSELDRITRESMAEQARTNVLRAEGDVVVAREKLAHLLGVYGPDLVRWVPDKLPELPSDDGASDDLERVAVSRRMDLLAARQDVEKVSRALALAAGTRWIGGASVGGSFEKSPEGFSVAGPSAGVELPIFDQKQAAVARLEAEQRAALSREAALTVDIRAQVRAAKGRLSVARRLVERYEAVVVPMQQRLVALSQSHYGAMLMGLYQLLQAKQSEIRTDRELIEALGEYWIARAELERATGGSVGSKVSSTGGKP